MLVQCKFRCPDMIWLNIKDRTFEATSPGDQVPSYDLPIFFKKCSHRGQTSPMKSNWFEIVGQVLGNKSL